VGRKEGICFAKFISFFSGSFKFNLSEGSPSDRVYVRKSSGLIRAISPGSALIANLVGIGIIVNIFWVAFASALYPNADLVATVPISFLMSILVAYVYWVLASAMPRTGGDYVYVGRIIHPGLGFMVNAMFVGIMITFAGPFAGPFFTGIVLPMLLGDLASATKNPYFTNLISLTTSPFVQFEIGVVIVTVVLLIMLLPVKWVFRTVVGLFGASAVVYVLFMGLLLSSSNSAFVSSFNANSGTTVSAVIAAAHNAGVNTDVTLSGTFIGIVYTMLSFIGYANSAYFAGEVSGAPKRSQGIAIMLSPIIFAVLTYFLYYEIYNVFGRTFLVASSSLAATSNTAWTNYTSILPSPAYLVSYLSNNVFLTAAVPIGLMITFIGFVIVYYLIPVRNIFAWSFDRVIPAKFAAVTDKGVPWVAVLFWGAVAYLSLYLATFTTVFNYLAYTNFGWWIAVAIVMFAATIFPYRKKDLYNSAPSNVRTKLGPVPLISILGAIGIGLSLFVSYATILPSYTGAPLNPVYIASILLIFVIAFIIYIVSYFYHKSRGVPVDLIAKELPPT
jgi:APA family basic amino acid/polyamine antiporter